LLSFFFISLVASSHPLDRLGREKNIRERKKRYWRWEKKENWR
jgi:hypothetical protein